jgi:hypothetical protein
MKLQHLELLVKAVVSKMIEGSEYIILQDIGGDPYFDRLLLEEAVREALEEA